MGIFGERGREEEERGGGRWEREREWGRDKELRRSRGVVGQEDE